MPIDHKAILARHLAARFGRRVLLGAAAAAGLGAPASLAQTARPGGQIRLAWIDFVDTLDPHFTGYLGAIKIHNNIYNGILKTVYDGKTVSFVPDLATSWDMPDDRTHIFKLRAGVKFHDGTPCDAEAVKWSMERVAKGEPRSPHAWKFSQLDRIDILDPLTVKLVMKQPYAFLPVALTGSTGRAGTIVSRAAVEKWGRDYGRHPVGTGPFRFVSWRENDQIVIEKNPDYFETGQPKLDRATFLLMREASSGVAAVMSGQADGLSNIPLQFLSQLRANPNLQVLGDIEGNYNTISLNCRRAPFDDVNLRRAVAFAIDREAMIKQAFFGAGIQAYTPISPPMTGFYDPEISKSGRGQTFDMEKARAFRARARNQGTVDAVFIASEQGDYGTRIAQTALPMLERIGIKAKLELMERAAWVNRRNAGDFDLFDIAWTADLDPDETIYPEWHSGENWNYGGWSNAEFDRLVEQAQKVIDVPTRRALYVRAEDILMDEAPMAILTHMPQYKILSKRLKGFAFIPNDSFDLHTVGF